MANTYRRYGLTGGASGALDALDGAALGSGDLAIVYDAAGKAYFYRLDPTSAAAESAPLVIAPDANAGDKRWLLTEFVCTEETITGLAGEGERYLAVDATGKLVRSTVDPSAIEDTTTRIVSGGSVVWESGYTYRVSKTVYIIEGEEYTFAGGTVTLDASHATLDRVDAIVVTTSSTAIKVAGTASEHPQLPTITPSSQIMLTWVYVPADTEAAPVTETVIYKEGTEWSIAASGAVITIDSTDDARNGTKSIEGTNVSVTDWITATAGAPIDLSAQDVMIFYIKLKAAIDQFKFIKLIWFFDAELTIPIGNVISIFGGSYGFDANAVDEWQQVVVPISQFGLSPGLNAETLGIWFPGSGANIGFYIDDVVLQAGGGYFDSSAHQSLRPRGDWANNVGYILNDTVFHTAGTYYCLFPNYNASPDTHPEYWALLSEAGASSALDGGVGMAFEASQKPVASGYYPLPPMPYAMTIPANCTGSTFHNEANPTAEQILSIKKNGTEFATCTVSTGGAATWSGTETSIAAGDIIGVGGFPASQDATWAGIAMTLKGARTI